MDKQAANRIVLAAVVLGGSIIVAAAIFSGGPWRTIMSGDGRRAVKTNTWTGESWQHIPVRGLGWELIDDAGE